MRSSLTEVNKTFYLGHTRLWNYLRDNADEARLASEEGLVGDPLCILNHQVHDVGAMSTRYMSPQENLWAKYQSFIVPLPLTPSHLPSRSVYIKIRFLHPPNFSGKVLCFPARRL